MNRPNPQPPVSAYFLAYLTMIRWVNALLKIATAQTIVIPGHGDVGDRAGLLAFRDMLVSVRSNVAKLKKQGKTLAETTAAFDAQYGDFLINPAFFIQMISMDV